ncbi:MAG: DUF2157 domain-containing protein [bacterium]|nr:DUF2157 domain-containing protein [bacterium]
MTAKQDAIVEVVDIIKRHGLTLEEVYAALQNTAEFKAQKSSSLLMRIFGYLGGLFVISGVATFIGMQWNDLGPAGQIMCTLGIGFCMFIAAITCTTDEKLEMAATPLFLLSAVLQPVGIAVLMDIFSSGGNPAHGVLFLTGVMMMQQGCAFIAKDRTVLAFTTLVFSGLFLFTALDLLEIPADLIGIVMGVSLTCIGWSLDKSKHKPLAWLCYLIGTCLVLTVAADILRNTPFEILFLGLSCGVIFLSTVARSRTLLVVGTIALLSYVGYFMDKYFGGLLAGPIGLILVGVLLIGAGVAAVKVNNKYIKQKG